MAAAKAPKKGTKRKREDEEDKNAVVVLPATSSIKQLRDGIKAQRQISAVETSRYDARSSRHFQFVNVQHREPFFLKTIKIPEGSLAEQEVIVLERIQPFRYNDLPAELRTLVLEKLFPKIKVRFDELPITHPRRIKQERARRVQNGVKSTYTSSGSSITDLKIKLAHPNQLAVLQVGKQTFREAAPVVYDRHTFVFDQAVGLNRFLVKLGGTRRFVREIEVMEREGSRGSISKYTFHLLKDAVDLRSLKLDHNLVCTQAWNETTPSSLNFVADSCEMFSLLSMKRGIAALDVLKVSWKKFFYCRESEEHHGIHDDREPCSRQTLPTLIAMALSRQWNRIA